MTDKHCTRLILIAEDDPDDQDLIAIAFSRVDPTLKICFVSDGQEALDYLYQTASDGLPCVIVLDYNMPELNGAQVLQQLFPDERFADIPKVIFSTSSNPLYIQDCMSKGANAYKVKPHDFSKLLDVAKEMAALCEAA
jgi:CheY-like chemotaxis protein